MISTLLTPRVIATFAMSFIIANTLIEFSMLINLITVGSWDPQGLFGFLRGIGVITVSYTHMFLWASYLDSRINSLLVCMCCQDRNPYFAKRLINWISNSVSESANNPLTRRILASGVIGSIVSSLYYRLNVVYMADCASSIKLISVLILLTEHLFNIYIWASALVLNEEHIETTQAARRAAQMQTDQFLNDIRAFAPQQAGLGIYHMTWPRNHVNPPADANPPTNNNQDGDAPPGDIGGIAARPNIIQREGYQYHN